MSKKEPIEYLYSELYALWRRQAAALTLSLTADSNCLPDRYYVVSAKTPQGLAAWLPATRPISGTFSFGPFHDEPITEEIPVYDDRYPHDCPHCKAPAYIRGNNTVDCTAKCEASK